MSKGKKVVKKVVVSSDKSKSGKTKVKATVSRRGQKSDTPESLVFGWENYKWMLIGIGIIALGMILMIGGSMPSPDVWDESLIYSFRRTVLAPLLIIAGFLVEVYAIFKK